MKFFYDTVLASQARFHWFLYTTRELGQHFSFLKVSCNISTPVLRDTRHFHANVEILAIFQRQCQEAGDVFAPVLREPIFSRQYWNEVFSDQYWETNFTLILRNAMFSRQYWDICDIFTPILRRDIFTQMLRNAIFPHHYLETGYFYANTETPGIVRSCTQEPFGILIRRTSVKVEAIMTIFTYKHCQKKKGN